MPQRNPRVIYAIDNSAEAIADALKQREALTVLGPFGPIDVPVVIIPGPSPFARTRMQ
jgi:hypothetical protein